MSICADRDGQVPINTRINKFSRKIADPCWSGHPACLCESGRSSLYVQIANALYTKTRQRWFFWLHVDILSRIYSYLYPITICKLDRRGKWKKNISQRTHHQRSIFRMRVLRTIAVDTRNPGEKRRRKKVPWCLTEHPKEIWYFTILCACSISRDRACPARLLLLILWSWFWHYCYYTRTHYIVPRRVKSLEVIEGRIVAGDAQWISIVRVNRSARAFE